MKIEYKLFEAEVKAFDDANLILDHFISTEHKDRGGDIMRAKGMRIVGKPVVLMLHGRGPMASEPIGKPLSITIDEFKGQPGILAKTQFFPDEVGTRLYQKAKGGFLPNWSIGYSVDEAKDIIEAGKYAGRDVTKWQLFEYSPVGVPMNPFAQTVKEFLDRSDAGEPVPERLAEAVKEGTGWFAIVEEKTCTDCGSCKAKAVIPYKKTPVAPADTKWDGPAQVAKADVATLKKICVWYDASKPDVKGSYKGPHHEADGDHALVPAAVKALAAVMMGARGGMNIPDADKAGIMAHVAKHYADCGMGDPPWKKEDGKHFQFAVSAIGTDTPEKLVILNELAQKYFPDLAEYFAPEKGSDPPAPPPDNVTDHKCVTCGEPLWKKWGGEAPPYKPEKVYCKAGCEIVMKTAEGPTLRDLCDSIQIVADNLSKVSLEFIETNGRVDELSKKLEPLLATLPPEPDGGDKGKGSEGNPPDGETPPHLVFRDVAKEEADRKKAEIDKVTAAVTAAIAPIMKAQVDKLMGRVP